MSTMELPKNNHTEAQKGNRKKNTCHNFLKQGKTNTFMFNFSLSFNEKFPFLFLLLSITFILFSKPRFKISELGINSIYVFFFLQAPSQ